MNKILLINQENSKPTQILHQFFDDLSPLLNIKGYFLETLEKPGQLKVNLFSQQSVSLQINLFQNEADIQSQIQPYIEKILSELSVFQLVDLFLLDRLGVMEAKVPRLKQQIITVFSSRIPVIATVQVQDVYKLNDILQSFPVKLIKLENLKESEVFTQLIKELYDE